MAAENHLKEVQGAVTSSLFYPHLFHDTSPVYNSSVRSAMLHASGTWSLTKPNLLTSAVEWQGNDQTDLQYQATRYSHHQVQWATCAAWHWGSGFHPEGEKASLVWTRGTLQPCSKTACDIACESLGLGGPRWHGSSWQRGIAESGSSQLSTLMTHLEIWCEICHVCSKSATCTWKEAHWWWWMIMSFWLFLASKCILCLPTDKWFLYKLRF